MSHDRAHGTVRAVLGGAVLGLAWGAALRGWMVTLALEFGDWPRFTGAGTFGSVLAPATVTGGLLGMCGGYRVAGKWVATR